jgi:riboflavin synthase
MEAHRLVVGCHTVATDAEIGASVAVNGVCLTVVERDGEALAFDVADETLSRSSLGRLAEGDPVNLERPVTLMTRLGGHLVQGHVDGVGTVESVDRDETGARLSVRIPSELSRYVAEKGSISVDGVSLTVAAVDGDRLTVALIPHTLDVTTFGSARPGDPVNVEVDVIAKYLEALVERREA